MRNSEGRRPRPPAGNDGVSQPGRRVAEWIFRDVSCGCDGRAGRSGNGSPSQFFHALKHGHDAFGVGVDIRIGVLERVGVAFGISHRRVAIDVARLDAAHDRWVLKVEVAELAQPGADLFALLILRLDGPVPLVPSVGLLRFIVGTNVPPAGSAPLAGV